MLYYNSSNTSATVSLNFDCTNMDKLEIEVKNKDSWFDSKTIYNPVVGKSIDSVTVKAEGYTYIKNLVFKVSATSITRTVTTQSYIEGHQDISTSVVGYIQKVVGYGYL